jgi:hypothetical protein
MITGPVQPQILLLRRNVTLLHTCTLHIVPEIELLSSIIDGAVAFVGDGDLDISPIVLVLPEETSEGAGELELARLG